MSQWIVTMVYEDDRRVQLPFDSEVAAREAHGQLAAILAHGERPPVVPLGRYLIRLRGAISAEVSAADTPNGGS